MLCTMLQRRLHLSRQCWQDLSHIMSRLQPPTPANQSASEQSLSEDAPVINVIQEQPLTETAGASRLPQTRAFAGVSQNISHLPKLTVPIFGGDPLKWQTFWDSFDSAVHSNNVLTNVQKLNYLRTHLEGEAARAIAGFPLTSVNYVPSVLRCPGDQQRIINAHMHVLMNLPNANNNIRSLRTFHDVVENHVCGLSALGQSTVLWGSTGSCGTRETSS